MHKMYENINKRILCRLDSALIWMQTSPVQVSVELVGLSQSDDETESHS